MNVKVVERLYNEERLALRASRPKTPIESSNGRFREECLNTALVRHTGSPHWPRLKGSSKTGELITTKTAQRVCRIKTLPQTAMGTSAYSIVGSSTPAHCSSRQIAANRRGTESPQKWPS